MFNLSTEKIECDNVFIAFRNCLNNYYHYVKQLMIRIEDSNDLNGKSFDSEILDIRKKYLLESKEMLFVHLRNEYKDFDQKFIHALDFQNSMYPIEYTQEAIEQGMMPGMLFYFVFIAIKNKEPKLRYVQELNHKVTLLMDQVLLNVDIEMSSSNRLTPTL